MRDCNTIIAHRNNFPQSPSNYRCTIIPMPAARATTHAEQRSKSIRWLSHSTGFVDWPGRTVRGRAGRLGVPTRRPKSGSASCGAAPVEGRCGRRRAPGCWPRRVWRVLRRHPARVGRGLLTSVPHSASTRSPEPSDAKSGLTF